GPQYRPADGRDLLHRALVEHPSVDGQAQPLARRRGRTPPAAGGLRPPPQAPLHDAGQDAAAQLHHLRLALGRRADLLPALFDELDARDLRDAGHADPAVAALGQESVREQERALVLDQTPRPPGMTWGWGETRPDLVTRKSRFDSPVADWLLTGSLCCSNC